MEDFVKVYEDSIHVNSYLKEKNLQLPEQAILNKYFDLIKNSTFLDIGIGTGRTTYHFNKIASHYVGTDISQGMINGAKKNFKNSNLTFLVNDARKMHEFADNSFDVIFFSFNGLDYINIDERILFFDEVKRIGKKNALLVFSTHNINSIPDLLKFKFASNIKILIGNIIHYCKLRIHNKSIDTSPNVIKINDGAHNFGLSTTYIKPVFQKQLLESYGFKDISCFGSVNGQEISDADIIKASDPWIYFACVVNA